MEKKKTYSEVVAEEFIEALKSGNSFVQKRWEAGELVAPFNPTTGNSYRGVNNIRLSGRNFSDPRWMTYKQASNIGANVKKGERGTRILFWLSEEKKYLYDEDKKPLLDEDGNHKFKIVKLDRPKAISAVVFNGEQIEGLPEYKPEKKDPELIHKRAEKILKDSQVTIKNFYQDVAFYSPSKDEISLPNFDQFISPASYYATALHELAHATGHESRMNRDLSGGFGSEKYAKEELRAEITSFMLSQKLGIEFDPERHKMYVKSWVKVLENDPKEITLACIDAEKITNYIMELEKNPDLSLDEIEPIKSVNDEMMPFEDKIYLNVPFSEKNEAKKLGAKWDSSEKKWYAPAGTDLKESGLDRWEIKNEYPKLLEGNEAIDYINKNSDIINSKEVLNSFQKISENYSCKVDVITNIEEDSITHTMSMYDKNNESIPISIVVTNDNLVLTSSDKTVLDRPSNRFEINHLNLFLESEVKKYNLEFTAPKYRIQEINLEWTEQNHDQNLTFENVEKLQEWFDKTYQSNDSIPQDGSYIKNKFIINVENANGDQRSIVDRVDVSTNKGDFNPKQENIAEYWIGLLDYYNIESTKERLEREIIEIEKRRNHLQGKMDSVVDQAVKLATITEETNFNDPSYQRNLVSKENPIKDEFLLSFYNENKDVFEANGLTFCYRETPNCLEIVSKEGVYPIRFLNIERGQDKSFKISYSSFDNRSKDSESHWSLKNHFKTGGTRGAGVTTYNSSNYNLDECNKDSSLIKGVIRRHEQHKELQNEFSKPIEKTYFKGSKGFEKLFQNENIGFDASRNAHFVITSAPDYKEIISEYKHELVPVIANETSLNTKSFTKKKTYLNVPFIEKDEASKLGAKWDKQMKSWYAPAGTDLKESGLDRWNTPVIKTTKSVEQQFSEALQEAGIEPPENFIADGKIHRVKTFDDKGNKKSGAYALHLNQAVAGGYIRNLKTGEEINWKADHVTSTLTPAERQQLQQEAEKARAKRELEISIQREKASNIALKLWSEAKIVDSHPYCDKKLMAMKELRVVPDEISQDAKDLGIRVVNNISESIAMRDRAFKNKKDVHIFVKGDLIIPLVDSNQNIKSLQTIQDQQNGSFKSFIRGGEKTGLFFPVNKQNNSAPLILAEGLATADAIAQIKPDAQVLSVFDAGNIVSVAEKMREKYPSREIFIASDNDHHEKIINGKKLPNIGVVKANEAKEKFNCVVITPKFNKEDKGTDWNDLLVDKGIDQAKKEFNQELRNETSINNDLER